MLTRNLTRDLVRPLTRGLVGGTVPGVTRDAGTLTWDGDTADDTPDFTYTTTDMVEDDTARLEWYSDVGLTTLVGSSENPVTAGEEGAQLLNFVVGSLTIGSYYFRAKHSAPSGGGTWSNTETVTLAAPTLSSPVATKTGNTTASGSVSTTSGNGTLYAVITTSSTGPTKAQVKAGQDHTGAAAADAVSQAVSVSGSQSISGGFTGLTGGTTYYAHYMHEDAGANQSTVATSSSFTTDAAGAFDVSYLNTFESTTDTGTWTFSAFGFGAADAGRKISISIYTLKADPAATITGVTIGGVTASLISGTNGTVATGGATHVLEWWEAAVPTGTSGDIVITCSATTVRCVGAAWRVVSGTASSGNKTSSTSASTLNSGANLTIPASGVGLLFAYNAGASDFSPWTNLTTEDFEKIIETTRVYSGGRRTTAGSTQVTCTCGASGVMLMNWVAYGP